MNGLYNVGVYIRLSMDDSFTHSDSIENQREMLSLFIDQMPGWVLHKNYVDNGYSGANFRRPGFFELMQDVRDGKVNLVLVKDLSRFGRNYLEAGLYLEEELPALGCRFVALTDGIDTAKGENDIMPFINAMNDYYLKNLSDRIRLSLRSRAQNGQKLAGTPYGFFRNSGDNSKLVIDPYASEIVRRIFEMRKNGAGYPAIVKVLNAEKIATPGIYLLERKGRDSSHIRTRLWLSTTVSMILMREAYIGTAVQLKTTVVSYRDKRQIFRPEEENVRVENAFPAIIDRETWDAVQEKKRQTKELSATRAKPQKSLFSGMIVCADCGVRMLYSGAPNTKGSRCFAYTCRTHSSTAGAACSTHRINLRILNQLVLGDIQRMAAQIQMDESAMLETLTKRLVGGGTVSKTDAKKEARLLEQELHKLGVAMSGLYEVWASGALTEVDFSQQMGALEAERQAKEQRLSLLEQTEQESAAKLADIRRWMELIHKYASTTELDRELLEALIEKVEIGERGPNQAVRIYYRFVGEL